MTIGLIINPRSGGKSGKGEQLRRLLGSHSSVETAVLEDFSELPALLRHMAHKHVDVLSISSGDGTIHAIQTELAESCPFPYLPKLMLLSHGTANMSAAAVGLNRPLPEIAYLLQDREKLDALPVITRPTLRVVNPADGKPRHGMFLGTGAVYAATAYCQNVVYPAGITGNVAVIATLLRSLFDGLFRRATVSPQTAIARSYELRVIADGLERFSPRGLLFLATTLDKLVLGSRPFWGGRTAPIRATGVRYPVSHLLRWILPALYGSEHRRMPDAAISFCATTLDIWGSTPYVLDGEFFDPPPKGPLRVETGPDFAYIRG
jgi:diacylglycerol kinase (ATP)